MKRYYLCLFSFFMMTAIQCQDSSTITTKKHRPSYAALKTTNGQISKGWLYQANVSEIFLIKKKKGYNPLTGIFYQNSSTTGLPTRFPTEQIEELRLKKQNAGTRGALIGLGIGAATGAIIGFASGDDPVKPYDGTLNDIGSSLQNLFAFTAGQKAAAGALVFGSVGTLTGLIIGNLAKKKFIIGGKKEKMEEKHRLIMQRAMIQ